MDVYGLSGGGSAADSCPVAVAQIPIPLRIDTTSTRIASRTDRTSAEPDFLIIPASTPVCRKPRHPKKTEERDDLYQIVRICREERRRGGGLTTPCGTASEPGATPRTGSEPTRRGEQTNAMNSRPTATQGPEHGPRGGEAALRSPLGARRYSLSDPRSHPVQIPFLSRTSVPMSPTSDSVRLRPLRVP
jgi:hypothetical protein